MILKAARNGREARIEYPVSSAALVPINTVGLRLYDVESAILQVLARGRKASLSEKGLAALLRAEVAEPVVTDWANRLAEKYQVTWSRRQRFGGLLFELVKPNNEGNA